MSKEIRRCQICGTRLNMYNNGPFCHAHTPGNVVYERIPITKCAGRPEPGGNPAPDAPEVDGFECIRVGIVDENNKLVREDEE